MLKGEAGGPTTDHQRRMIEEAEKSCERLITIINEIGEVARLDTGSVPARTTSTDLFELVREAAADLRTADEGAVSCRFLGADGGAVCLADRPRLGAAFLTFMTAIAREQADAATVAIERRILAENGAARAVIVMGQRESEPDLHLKPHEPVNERRGGLGLALPIARRIVEAHGGQVWSPAEAATSGAPRHTVVVMSFPLT
jgi:signal transduction histidine kinase